MPSRPGPRDAHRIARRNYLAGERIDPAAIATELGVNRATVFRWVGNRDQLLAETAWSLAHDTLSLRWSELREEPGPRVPRLVGTFLRDLVTQPGSRRIMLEQNDRMMRVMTLAEYGFQPRLAAALSGYLAEDLAEGRINSTLGLDDLTFATVRITESYIYLPTIAGLAPDPDGAERVLGALLRP